MAASDRYPRFVESYHGIEIWYNPVRGLYTASHCEHSKRSPDIRVVKKWIDSEKL